VPQIWRDRKKSGGTANDDVGRFSSGFGHDQGNVILSSSYVCRQETLRQLVLRLNQIRSVANARRRQCHGRRLGRKRQRAAAPSAAAATAAFRVS